MPSGEKKNYERLLQKKLERFQEFRNFLAGHENYYASVIEDGEESYLYKGGKGILVEERPLFEHEITVLPMTRRDGKWTRTHVAPVRKFFLRLNEFGPMFETCFPHCINS